MSMLACRVFVFICIYFYVYSATDFFKLGKQRIVVQLLLYLAFCRHFYNKIL